MFTALQCFWIVKTLPFHDIRNSSNSINIFFAAYLFLNMVKSVANKTGKKANITKQIVTDLCYGFYYQDISKEALMRIAESLIIGYDRDDA
jgi:Glu-tRNA(Gln) amidotransferase subunit E-like FAD-binding protein